MLGQCKLCKKHSKLENSHFIPKFIGRWIKKTSITGFLREYDNVEKRQQDIAKEYWLCGSCEDRFSVWETKFANTIFYPFVNEEQHIANYDSWLAKFSASLSWRTLTYVREKNIENGTYNKNPEYVNAINLAEDHMSKFLLGEVDNLNQYEQHIFPLEPIESSAETSLPTNINRYFLRNMSMDIVGNDENIFVFTKIPRFVILGCIKAREKGKLRNSRVSLSSGKIKPRDYWWPDGFVNYMFEEAKKISVKYEEIPEVYHKKFDEYIRKNPEKTVDSELFKAFLHDYKRFGKKSLRP